MAMKIGAKAGAAKSPAKADDAKPGQRAGFMKSGSSAKKAMEEENARAEQAKEEAGKLWRFFITGDDIGEVREVIFLDGNLITEGKDAGTIDYTSWMEHSVMMPNGRGGKSPQNYVCTEDQEPCPICAGGDSPSLVFGFTVIDLRPYEIKNGDRKGQIIEYSRKLFVCKRRTATQLQRYATKNDGLRGVKMEIVRSSSTVASVGDTFDPIEKWDDEELEATYGDMAQPADYSQEIVYRTAEELVKLGVAEAIPAVKSPGASKDLAGKL